jgi:hypothetical protein
VKRVVAEDVADIEAFRRAADILLFTPGFLGRKSRRYEKR